MRSAIRSSSSAAASPPARLHMTCFSTTASTPSLSSSQTTSSSPMSPALPTPPSCVMLWSTTRFPFTSSPPSPKITDKGCTVKNVKTGEKFFVECDNVVNGIGFVPTPVGRQRTCPARSRARRPSSVSATVLPSATCVPLSGAHGMSACTSTATTRASRTSSISSSDFSAKHYNKKQQSFGSAAFLFP